MRRAAVSTLLVVLGVVLAPAAALACPTCVSSAFGDRTYNWAYLGLLVMPFVLTAVVGAIISCMRTARRSTRRYMGQDMDRLRGSHGSHVVAGGSPAAPTASASMVGEQRQ